MEDGELMNSGENRSGPNPHKSLAITDSTYKFSCLPP